MKSANSSNRPARSTRAAGLRLWLVAPLCLLALACGLLAGNHSRAAAQLTGQKTKAGAADASGKGKARARAAQPDGRVKPSAEKKRNALPLADQIGCARDPLAISPTGGTATGNLAAGDCQHPADGSFYDGYTFNGTAGQFIIIEMTTSSTSLDPYLSLVRPGETPLSYRTIQNDDSVDLNGNDTLNARLVGVLPDTGTYTIMANSAEPNETGPYQLTVRGGCLAASLNANTNVSAALGTGDCLLHDNTLVDVYSYRADTAGQQIAVTMSSSVIDPFLFLLSTDGFTELARNDDGVNPAGGNVDARIPAPGTSGAGSGFATLPAAGTYYVIANVFPNVGRPATSGAYTLRLDRSAANCPTQTITAGQTTAGQSLTTSDCRLPFDGSFMDVYTFEGTQGQQIAITMTSTAVNAFLLLYDPAGYLIDDDNNGAGGTDSRIPAGSGFVTLPVTGTYRIYANAALPDQTGAYQLSVVSAANCGITLAQTSRQNVPSAGGQFTDTYTLPAGCPAPAATSNSAFITNVTVNAAQNSFTYTVAQNTTGQSRTGTITVGGQTFTVTQQASCTVGLSPTVSPFAQAGGTGRFTVVPDNNNAQCAWAAATTANWITINTGATGVGTSRVTYTVAANSTGATRTGTVVVNGQVHTVSQLAGAAPTVAFSSAAYSAGEADGSPRSKITITVTRLGDTAGASTVDYRTLAETDAQAQVPCRPTQGQPTGTASPRCDYATTIDTLIFAPGSAQATFDIPLINDIHVEGPETFQIELLNAGGATLGATTTATVTITDNDTGVSATNPVRPPLPYNATTNSPFFFVRMQYLDFLLREPEASEPWTNVLLRPGCNPEAPPSAQTDCDRIAVSQSFFESEENRIKGRFIFLYHKATFGSAANPNYFPEYRDFINDLRRVTGATSAETNARRLDFAEQWVARADFVARYGGKTNAQFVDEVLANVNSTLTQAGSGFTRDSLVAELTNGTKTRAEVLRLIVESPEVSEQQFNHAYVATQYYGYLRRTPELSGYLAWLAAISQNRNNLRVMVDGFMNSQEYLLRFGPAN